MNEDLLQRGYYGPTAPLRTLLHTIHCAAEGLIMDYIKYTVRVSPWGGINGTTATVSDTDAKWKNYFKPPRHSVMITIVNNNENIIINIV